MLSSENHHPPADDPHEISLKGVDLSNPSFDEHNNPIPKFSIRDYVFNTRSKNIKTNWPFSEKNLQLCLKHGVKDILPPFQCRDCVKNRFSISKSDCVESSLSEKQKVTNSDMDPPNQAVNKKLSVIKNNNTPAEVFPNISEKPVSHQLKKTENLKPSSVKKCKLIVKVGSSSNSNTGSSSVVEPVASSKLCPVCKKFSSSSNTKLNAHIDQCLSVESPVEPVTKSRVMKHKIKPKRIRLMVDIYATAPHCTIEELDRRNGRIWSEKPASLPTIQEDKTDWVDKEKEKQKQSVGFDEKGEDGDKGAVYIDAKGTKLRILNKISSDTSSASKLGVNPIGLRKPLKRGKESKLLLSYKKKQKHNKYSKLACQREKVCSYKTRLASRVVEDQEEDKSMNEIPKEDENIGIYNNAESSKSREPIIKTGSLIPKWASGSKGTGLLKRRVQSDESSLCESYIERSYSQKVHNWYEIPKKAKKTDNFPSEGPTDDGCQEQQQQPFSKKKMEFKSVKSRSFSSVDQTFSSSRREPMLSTNHAPKSSKKIGHEYSEKHLKKHQNRIDQVPNKKSVLKIKKKKQAAITSHRNELAQDHGNHEPSRFADVELPLRDELVIGQSLGGHDSGNVMSLGKSFDQDFYSIGGIEIGHATDVEDQSNYFSGVDPITIPGPPGSFLPSPGRTSSEEEEEEDHHQGNSSLTNSQVQSSIDNCLELVDRDSSNSPKSAHSTVSNTLLARSECLEPPRVPEDEIIKIGFSDVITKSTLGFQDNNQPCCCSRKEGVSVNSQEYSRLLKRRVMSSSPAPTREDKQPSPYQNITVSPPVYGDFGSPSPSSPNPILRLMGKDLVVVNNDENINHSPNSKPQAGHLDDHHVQVSPNYGYRRTVSDLHEYKPSFINRSLNSPFSSPLGYNKTERVGETHIDTVQRNNTKDDVIVIDDAPENEARADFMNVIQESSGGFPIPLAGYYNPRHLNPFSSYQGPDFNTYRSPHMIPNNSSPVSPSSLGPMRWNNSVLEGSRMPPSPSAKRAKSSLYYSPSMS